MKAIVIGSPGSGKSVLSRALKDEYNIPLFYLDILFWRENWSHISREELLEKIEEITVNYDNWIIDGNYDYSLEYRFYKCDTIFFLDIPLETCLASVKERIGKPREDLPSFLTEHNDPEFINYIKDFQGEMKSHIIELINKYKENKKVYIFHSRDEVNKYIDSLSKVNN